MTKEEFRNHKEYETAVNKIKNYSQGFKVSIPYRDMTKAQQNAMDIVIKDCEDAGLIECVSIDLDLGLNITEKTIIRK